MAKQAPKEEGKSLNLYQRIHAVMGDVKRLQKDKSVGSGNYAYKAMSEEKVVTEIRTAMLAHGLAIFPIEQEHIMEDKAREQGKIVSLSTVNVRYKLVNIDNPSEFEVVVSSGTGVDSQDKGVGKAMTYSMKYALLRTFMIPTGQDPDDIHNEDLAQQQASAAAPKPVAAPPVQGSPSPAPSGGAASGGEAVPAVPVQYATAPQKEEIIRLLNHPVITRPEKTKMLLNINRLDEERAVQAIAKLRKAIDNRENGEKAAE